MNPENKCAQLYEEKKLKKPLHEMFAMQLELQRDMLKRGKGIDFENASFKDKVDELTKQWRNFNTEFTELLERLPFKEWKTYTSEELKGYIDKEHERECKYEYIDMWHFFINVGLLLGVSADEFVSLYVTKNKENFDRQDRGY